MQWTFHYASKTLPIHFQCRRNQILMVNKLGVTIILAIQGEVCVSTECTILVCFVFNTVDFFTLCFVFVPDARIVELVMRSVLLIATQI